MFVIEIEKIEKINFKQNLEDILFIYFMYDGNKMSLTFRKEENRWLFQKVEHEFNSNNMFKWVTDNCSLCHQSKLKNQNCKMFEEKIKQLELANMIINHPSIRTKLILDGFFLEIK